MKILRLARIRGIEALLLLLPAIPAPCQSESYPGLITGILAARSSTMLHGFYASTFPDNAVDSLRLNLGALDAMARRLGAEPIVRNTNEYCYERRLLGRKTYDFCFLAEWLPANLDTAFVDSNAWSIDTVKLRKNRMVGRYYFSTYTSDDFTVTMNLAEFLRSAYHQELFPEYRARDPLFLPPMRQSQSGLWMRGAASMGWAAGYAVEDNPFTGHPSALKTLFYLLDGLVGGVGVFQCVNWINEGTPEKIPPGLLALKAGHSALSLAIFTPLLSIELGETLRIRNTGYRFPKTLYLEGRPPRFRDD